MFSSLAIRLFISLVALLPTGCSPGGNPSRRTPAPAAATDVKHHISAMWEGVNASTLPPDTLEQRTVDYLYLMQHIEPHEREELWTGFLRAQGDEIPSRTVCDYLGKCDSPLYDPELLCEYLHALLDELPAGDPRQSRIIYLLENYNKNLPGTPVGNVPLMNVGTGACINLRSLFQNSPGDNYLLLYDPECDVCTEVIATLPRHLQPGDKAIAVSVASASKAMQEPWQSFIVPGGEDVVEQYFYVDELPALYLIDSNGYVISRRM